MKNLKTNSSRLPDITFVYRNKHGLGESMGAKVAQTEARALEFLFYLHFREPRRVSAQFRLPLHSAGEGSRKLGKVQQLMIHRLQNVETPGHRLKSVL
jgi:hypothetical protein